MNILIDSKQGDALGLGLAMQREGHDVVIAVEKTEAQLAGEGLLEHVPDGAHYAREEADLVIFDMVGNGGRADAYRSLGIPTFGAGHALDQIELDRIFGLRTFKALGLTIPETKIFDPPDFDAAMQFVEQDGDRWVFKPCGNLGTDKTFLAEDAEEMVEYIEHLRDGAKNDDVKFPAFVLQRFVKGIEVSIERWYSHGQPIPELDNITFEEKKFLAGNLGPAVGCMGNVVFPPLPWLVQATVAHLDRYAAAHRISSPIDLNAIVDDQGTPHILEATARFGYDALWAFLRKWHMPYADTFLALAEGDESLTVVLDPRMAAAVRVSVPPYPGGDPTKSRGLPIVDDLLDDDDIWPGDVMEEEDGDLVVAGVDGVVAIYTSLGTSIDSAYDAIYDRLEDSRIPDRQYRVDLRDRVSKQYPKLLAMEPHARRPAA